MFALKEEKSALILAATLAIPFVPPHLEAREHVHIPLLVSFSSSLASFCLGCLLAPRLILIKLVA